MLVPLLRSLKRKVWLALEHVALPTVAKMISWVAPHFVGGHLIDLSTRTLLPKAGPVLSWKDSETTIIVPPFIRVFSLLWWQQD